MPPVLDTEEKKLADSNGGGPRDLGPDHGGGGDGDEGNSDPNYVPGAGLLAMRLVLVSVSMLFVTVGVAYYARSRSPIGWQHIRVPSLLWVSTALILASGWTLENRAQRRGGFPSKALCKLGRRYPRHRLGFPGVADPGPAGARRPGAIFAPQSAQFSLLCSDGRARLAPARRDAGALLSTSSRAANPHGLSPAFCAPARPHRRRGSLLAFSDGVVARLVSGAFDMALGRFIGEKPRKTQNTFPKVRAFAPAPVSSSPALHLACPWF